MGKLTQYIDYLERPPDKFSLDFVIACYTHIEITPEMKKTRRKLKWYRNNKQTFWRLK